MQSTSLMIKLNTFSNFRCSALRDFLTGLQHRTAKTVMTLFL